LFLRDLSDEHQNSSKKYKKYVVDIKTVCIFAPALKGSFRWKTCKKSRDLVGRIF